MKKRLLFLLTLAAVGIYATAQDANPPDTNALLKSLEELRQKHGQAGQTRLTRLIAEINTAAASDASAVDLYERAIQVTTFVGKTKEQGQFQEWKRKESDRLKSNALRTAARLHLRYLAIMLRAAGEVPTEELLPDLIRYTNEVAGVLEDESLRADLEKQELFRKNVAGGIFSQWYGVDAELGKLKGWEGAPGNLDGIYQKTILPEFRKKKDPNLLRYWDARLQREEKAAQASRLTFRIEHYNQVTRPALIWSRAQDVVLLGHPNHAINEMYGLIRDFPSHPDNLRWIEQLEALLKPKPEEPTETASLPGAAQ